MESIQSKISPLVQRAITLKTARDYDNVETSWAYKSATLSVELPRKTRSKLASYFPGKADVPFEKANAQRQSVTLAHPRRDYRDRATLRLPLFWRLAKLRFRKEGIDWVYDGGSQCKARYRWSIVLSRQKHTFQVLPENCNPWPGNPSGSNGCWRIVLKTFTQE